MRGFYNLGLAACALQVSIAMPAFANPIKWKVNNHLYEVIYAPIGINWANAQLHAAALGCGWYLATITSAAEDAFVFSLIAKQPSFFADGTYGPWLGAFQKNSIDEPSGDWRWVTKEPFSYTNWRAGYPDNYSQGTASIEPGITAGQHEDFVEYLSNGQWNDLYQGPWLLTVGRVAPCAARGH